MCEVILHVFSVRRKTTFGTHPCAVTNFLGEINALSENTLMSLKEQLT